MTRQSISFICTLSESYLSVRHKEKQFIMKTFLFYGLLSHSLVSCIVPNKNNYYDHYLQSILAFYAIHTTFQQHHLINMVSYSIEITTSLHPSLCSILTYQTNLQDIEKYTATVAKVENLENSIQNKSKQGDTIINNLR